MVMVMNDSTINIDIGIIRPIATDVARSVISLSVCWTTAVSWNYG